MDGILYTHHNGWRWEQYFIYRERTYNKKTVTIIIVILTATVFTQTADKKHNNHSVNPTLPRTDINHKKTHRDGMYRVIVL